MGRLGYFDMAKGIAILLVIIGHNAVPVAFKHFIFSFHMPFFFIVSGYFIKTIEIKEVIRKGWIQLLRPYLFTSLCILLFFGVFQILQNQVKNIPYDFAQFYDFLYKIITGHIGAVWFLLALFVAKLFLTIAFKVGRPFVVTLLFAVIGYVFGNMDLDLPVQIFPGMIASLYLFIGYQMKRYDVFNFKIDEINMVAASFVVYLSSASMFLAFSYYFPNYIFSILSSSVITFCILKNCQMLEVYKNNKVIGILVAVLVYLGQNSLIILCFHTMEMVCNPWKYVAFIGDGPMLCLKIVILSIIPLGIKYVPIVNIVFNKK